MNQQSYMRFLKKDLILRDQLAIDRTVLAAERTSLAYFRTAVTLFIAGLTMIKFFNIFYIQVIGSVLLPISVIITLIGFNNYRKSKKFANQSLSPGR